jgi:hypothetical protein
LVGLIYMLRVWSYFLKRISMMLALLLNNLIKLFPLTVFDFYKEQLFH